jgi:hypothetical protein
VDVSQLIGVGVHQRRQQLGGSPAVEQHANIRTATAEDCADNPDNSLAALSCCVQALPVAASQLRTLQLMIAVLLIAAIILQAATCAAPD